MKVALLSDCYPPRMGGIERQVHDLAHGLARAGHTVEVFTATSGPGGERHGATTSEEDGVLVHRLALPLPGGIPVNPFAPAQVRRLLASGDFDVAHAHLGVVSPFATDLVPVALDSGVPVAATFHCVLGPAAPAVRLVGHVRRWAGRGVALSAVSTMAAGQVAGVAGGAEVAVLGNGVDGAWWSPAGTDEGRSSPGLHVVTAMRLVSRKRPIAFLRMLARARALLSQEVPFRVTVAGDGPQRRVMDAFLRARGMGWVDLAGRLDRQGLRALHHSADVYVSSARLEAFGIAALEARAAGLPVVALRGTGVDDIVRHGVDGLLVPDDPAMAAALAGLSADPLRLAALHAVTRSTPPRQDWAGVLEATVSEYRRAGG